MVKKESPDWNEIWDKYYEEAVEKDLRRQPEKIREYKRNPTRTLHNTIRTHLIKQPRRLIKNVDRDGAVVHAGKMRGNLLDYLKEEEPEIMPKIEFKTTKTKTKRILVYKKGRRGIFKNFPSMKKYHKWRKK